MSCHPRKTKNITMKNALSILICFVFIFLASCSNSDDPQEMASPDPDSNPLPDDPVAEDLTYEADIKAIIDANCISCHGNPPTNNAPMSLVTYDDVTSAVDNRGLLNRINSTTNPMPPGGQLPGNTRQLIEDWINQGMPEN